MVRTSSVSLTFLPVVSPPGREMATTFAEESIPRRPAGMVSGGLKATVVSASSGAVASAFVVAPFDVVKTRSQASGSQATGCGNMALRVLRQEGVGALWSGLRPSLLMTVPANVIYFSAYEHIRIAITSDGRRGSEDLAPVVLAAAGAKLLASTATAPLELMRTRMQADRAFAQEGIVGGATALVRREGLSALFKGLGPTLIRDVPFSCVYWLGYERLKLLFVEPQPPHQHLHQHQQVSLPTSFVAGGLAGAAATLLTMPLDVVKTRMQVAEVAQVAGVVSGVVSGPLLTPLHSAAGAAGAAGVAAPAGGVGGGGLSTAAMMARIARLEGPRALLAGTVPRLAKMAPSCAIMIASFEMGKRWIEPALR